MQRKRRPRGPTFSGGEKDPLFKVRWLNIRPPALMAMLATGCFFAKPDSHFSHFFPLDFVKVIGAFRVRDFPKAAVDFPAASGQNSAGTDIPKPALPTYRACAAATLSCPPTTCRTSALRTIAPTTFLCSHVITRQSPLFRIA
jgi:hypothetical protein